MKQLFKFDFNDKRIFLIVCMAVIIGVIVLDFMLFIPIAKSLQESKNQHKNDTRDLTLAKDLLSKHGPKNKMSLISQDRAIQVMDSISQLADQSDLNSSFQNMDGQEKEIRPELPYKEKVFVLNVMGSLKNLGSFLTKIKNIPDIIDIDSVNISRSGKNNSDVKAQITIVLVMNK